jgi:hypothetical protein
LRGIAVNLFLAAVGAAPAPDTPLIDRDLAFRQHDGGNTDAFDWPTFVIFSSRYLHAPGRQ